MAPIPEKSVEDQLKETIQHLFEIQSSVHGYLGPETQQSLVRKIHQLTLSLSSLSVSSSTLASTNLTPEVIQYVDDGRNPDIYNREFVESLQKNNQYLKGKSDSFAGFRDCLAEEIVGWRGELRGQVGEILEGRRGVSGEGQVEGQGEGEGVKINGDAGGGRGH